MFNFPAGKGFCQLTRNLEICKSCEGRKQSWKKKKVPKNPVNYFSGVYLILELTLPEL